MATTKLTTIDDLWQIEEPGRYDLIRGELYHVPPAGGEHGRLEAHIIARLWNHVQPRQLGEVFSDDTGFTLSHDPAVWLSPDVAFVSAGRLPTPEEQIGFMPLAPDFAIEIVSPSDRSSLVTQKVMEYLRFGTRLVWVIDPRARLVTAYTPDRPARDFTGASEIDCGDVVPGFRIRVSELFP